MTIAIILNIKQYQNLALSSFFFQIDLLSPKSLSSNSLKAGYLQSHMMGLATQASQFEILSTNIPPQAGCPQFTRSASPPVLWNSKERFDLCAQSFLSVVFHCFMMKMTSWGPSITLASLLHSLDPLTSHRDLDLEIFGTVPLQLSVFL